MYKTSFLLFIISFIFMNTSNAYTPFQTLSKEKNIVIFISASILPLTSKNLVSTPNGKMIYISNKQLDSLKTNPKLTSQGMFINGDFVVLRSNNEHINFYHYSKNNSNLYGEIAPNIYALERFANNYYKIKQIPKDISKCKLIINTSFETKKPSIHGILLDLDTIPKKGVEHIVLECQR